MNTPRTDAAAYQVVVGHEPDGSSATEMVVDVSECRKLETELAAALAQIAGYREALQECKFRACRIERMINNGDEGIQHDVTEIECCVNVALVAPAPLVVSRSELEAAEQDADLLYVELQYMLQNWGQEREYGSVEKTLAAHEARKSSSK